MERKDLFAMVESPEVFDAIVGEVAKSIDPKVKPKKPKGGAGKAKEPAAGPPAVDDDASVVTPSIAEIKKMKKDEQKEALAGILDPQVEAIYPSLVDDIMDSLLAMDRKDLFAMVEAPEVFEAIVGELARAIDPKVKPKKPKASSASKPVTSSGSVASKGSQAKKAPKKAPLSVEQIKKLKSSERKAALRDLVHYLIEEAHPEIAEEIMERFLVMETDDLMLLAENPDVFEMLVGEAAAEIQPAKPASKSSPKSSKPGKSKGKSRGPPPEPKIDYDTLDRLDVKGQKKYLGELLFPLVEYAYPDQVKDVLEVMLAMDVGDLIALVESPEARDAIITECLDMLIKDNTKKAGCTIM
jgi:hypothetical protein